MYYSGWACWTNDVKKAAIFAKPEDAIQMARSEMMGQMELVIHKGNPVVEQVVPIVEPGKKPS
jgi:hypothetical protein